MCSSDLDLPRKQKHRLATFQFIILKIDMEPACAAFHKAKHIIVILMLICNRHLYSLPDEICRKPIPISEISEILC